tara:strand:+ start:1150 stop:2028 length:879 start_codon:yes stop_codon:yes gene_type:complete
MSVHQDALTVVAALDGETVTSDDYTATNEPIRLAYIVAGCDDPAAVVRDLLPRLVYRGLIYGEAHSLAAVLRHLAPTIGRSGDHWVYSHPWRKEDHERLQADHPELVIDPVTRLEIINELAPVYSDYVANVSVFDMAMSLETAVFLLHLCRATQPASVADYGSGFSSWVFRHYAANNDCVVHSFDDDPEWLAKSVRFCARNGQDTDGFNVWRLGVELPAVDVTFHDIGGGELRNELMAPVMASAARFAVVDDCQATKHRDRFYELIEAQELQGYALLQTHDHIQRFAMLGAR